MASDPQKDKYSEVSPAIQVMVDEFFELQYRYQAALREVQTKLEILDSEFQSKHKHNPIHHMQSRLKSIPSIIEKLQRKGLPVTMESAAKHLTDLAGVRVICSYIDDIYLISNLLLQQDDVRVVKERDYIQYPKKNGYRSLHLVIEIPVFLQEGKEFIPVEVQIRTIAMDFWASLEHSLRYKGIPNIPEDISKELHLAAMEIQSLDERMQSIHNRVERLAASSQEV